ncbi:hypothetical protein D1170_25355, partial [Escherichia coli]
TLPWLRIVQVTCRCNVGKVPAERALGVTIVLLLGGVVLWLWQTKAPQDARQIRSQRYHPRVGFRMSPVAWAQPSSARGAMLAGCLRTHCAQTQGLGTEGAR